MAHKSKLLPLVTAISTAALLTAPHASMATTSHPQPLSSHNLPSGYKLAAHNNNHAKGHEQTDSQSKDDDKGKGDEGKCGEGKCGEGKCG